MAATQPRFPITGLRSVELLVPDLDKAVTFYCDVWGLVETSRDSDAVYLRGSGSDPYLIALRSSDCVAVESVTYRADAGTDLETLRASLLQAGAPAVGEVAERPSFGGGQGFEFRDLSNRRLVIVQHDQQLAPLPGGGSRPTRLAHVNMNCADITSEIAFNEQGLGFLLTDLSSLMGFLRTNDDHHAIVLANETVSTLNHIAFLHDTLEDVMIAGGRMCDAGYPIAWGPGRHGPGDNVFLYFLDPFGIVIEHTAEILIVDDSYKFRGPADWNWPPGRSDQWGIGVHKSDATKRAQRAIPFD